MEKRKDKKALTKPKKNNDGYLSLKDSIKSLYIFKKIFLFLEEKIELNLIKPSKSYKNLLGINIEEYKKVSGKIKIGGKIGYNRIYELISMSLIFEGEYLNGKKNGNGKEYYKDYSIFDDEHLISDRNGKGNKLIFEGEYKDGIKNGKGREYDNKENLIFDGEYLDGK